MKKLIMAGLIVAGATGTFAETVFVQDRDVFVHEANYDKSKISPYTLEDPLTFVDGRKVKNAADWAERRKEILGIFAKEMYGEEPPKPDVLITELQDEKKTVDTVVKENDHAMDDIRYFCNTIMRKRVRD